MSITTLFTINWGDVSIKINHTNDFKNLTVQIKMKVSKVEIDKSNT